VCESDLNERKIRLCLVPEYASTLGIKNGEASSISTISIGMEGGTSIRNKYIFTHLIKGLQSRGFQPEIIKLSKEFKLNAKGLFAGSLLKLMSPFHELEPLRESLLFNASNAIKVNLTSCDVVFLHHYFSLLKYAKSLSKLKASKWGRVVVYLEMPTTL
jgi:hypothetical protein